MKIKDANVILNTATDHLPYFSRGDRMLIGGSNPWIPISGWHRLLNYLNEKKFIIVGTHIIQTKSIVDVDLVNEPERELEGI